MVEEFWIVTLPFANANVEDVTFWNVPSLKRILPCSKSEKDLTQPTFCCDGLVLSRDTFI